MLGFLDFGYQVVGHRDGSSIDTNQRKSERSFP